MKASELNAASSIRCDIAMIASVAEYDRLASHHTAHGMNSRCQSTWQEPDGHQWRGVTMEAFTSPC